MQYIDVLLLSYERVNRKITGEGVHSIMTSEGVNSNTAGEGGWGEQ